ncbi:MAG TPA: glutathione S-transferase N-terminal domain-containing protein [Candidatus Polarisedimenticolia bacterium]|nr:glutathione S-transferase N-terminal domain-containing protein [Candidatus Polarisedimenticolia bacterium]
MGDDMVLYIGEKNVSSWSMRGWLAVQHKGLPFEERTIELRQDKDRAQRRRVSPTGRVPVLRHGDRLIPDSLAIVEYLEETFPPPAHKALWPREPEARAHARWLAATMHSGFMKLRESMSFNLCFLPKPPAPTSEALQEADEMLRLLQDALGRGCSGGPFLFGAFCATDIMYAPAIVRLTSFRVPTAGAPATPGYMEAVLSQPLVKRWMDAARALPPRETY